MSDNNTRLVYSTDVGRITEKKVPTQVKGDGIVRIRRETKGRKGKGVTTLDGFLVSSEELKTLCTAMKKTCGTGGAIKNSVIEIQGDNREKLKSFLEKKGFTVKLAGG